MQERDPGGKTQHSELQLTSYLYVPINCKPTTTAGNRDDKGRKREDVHTDYWPHPSLTSAYNDPKLGERKRFSLDKNGNVNSTMKLPTP